MAKLLTVEDVVEEHMAATDSGDDDFGEKNN
jgi:hypothetical protein